MNSDKVSGAETDEPRGSRQKPRQVFDTSGSMARSAVAIAAVALLGLCVASHPARADASSDLAAVETKIAAEFTTLDHMEPATLAALPAAGDSVLIFDVREAAEFAVSHLRGATRVAPNSDPTAFAASVAAAAKGKAVVFYCSVGMRSSRLSSKAAPLLMAQGAASVHNLRGGIFRWSNEGRPLEKGTENSGKASNSGVTVHPYNASWGKLIATPSSAAH